MSRFVRVLSFVALFGAVALVIILSRQVRDVRADLVDLRARMLFPRVGETVPPFDAMTLDGTPVRLGEGPPGSRQLLIAFNTACPICVETAPAWRRLDSLVAGIPGLTVLGWSQHADSLTRPYVA